jgi:uncharacterized protein (DUF2141 family)
MQAAIRSAILLLAAVTGLAGAADLTIRIDNVENNDGRIMVALYDGADAYMKRPLQTAAVEAVAGATTVQFKDLAPGEYAFAIFHDANGNGRLDRNRMGMPTEMHTFSNDAQGFMGPPSFDAARFALPAAGRAVTVNLRQGSLPW